MHSWGKYILSVGLASLFVAIIGEFSDRKSAMGKLIRIICGLFLAFSVINPLTELNFGILEAFSLSWEHDASESVSAGTTMANESMAQIIKKETEAYILDKARLLGCSLDAVVTVEEGSTPHPVSVQIVGDIPVQIRNKLEEILETELEISKENQEWIGK